MIMLCKVVDAFYCLDYYARDNSACFLDDGTYNLYCVQCDCSQYGDCVASPTPSSTSPGHCNSYSDPNDSSCTRDDGQYLRYCAECDCNLNEGDCSDSDPGSDVICNNYFSAEDSSCRRSSDSDTLDYCERCDCCIVRNCVDVGRCTRTPSPSPTPTSGIITGKYDLTISLGDYTDVDTIPRAMFTTAF